MDFNEMGCNVVMIGSTSRWNQLRNLPSSRLWF